MVIGPGRVIFTGRSVTRLAIRQSRASTSSRDDTAPVIVGTRAVNAPSRATFSVRRSKSMPFRFRHW